MELIKLSIKDALDGFTSGKFTATDLIDAHIKQIKKTHRLNIFITPMLEYAMERAKESDIRIKNSNMRPLEGVPVSVKDNFCMDSIATTAGSKMLEGFVPKYTATIVQKLLDAGAIIIGKTNMDEYAMGVSNITSYFGKVISPWHTKEEYSPGGSSGGSAASVSAFCAMASIGSDTGGSVRHPAAFTGTVGVRPSYGRCSRYGMIPYSSSIDQAGVIARNCEDAALVQEVIMGYDAKDSTSVDRDVEPLVTSSYNIKGMRIAAPKEIMADEHVDSAIKDSWVHSLAMLKEMGAEIIEMPFVSTDHALAAYYTITPAEASSNFAKYDGIRYGYNAYPENLEQQYIKTRSEGFGEEVQRRMMVGMYVLSSDVRDAYYLKGLKVRRVIKEQFDKIFSKADAVVMPTTPTSAFKFSEMGSDPVKLYRSDMYLIPASLASVPAVSVPVGLCENKMPVSVQVITDRFEEAKMMAIAKAIETKVNIDFSPRGFEC